MSASPGSPQEPLWRPSPERVAAANVTAFASAIGAEWGTRVADFPGLHRFSVEEPERFWRSLWSFAGVIAERRGDVVLRGGDRMPGAEWFPDARLNFAENCLRRGDDQPALIFANEVGARLELSFAELTERVARLRRWLRDEAGVAPGDRVAAYLPNVPETVVAMLAASSLGAVFSSCSPDFGVRGVVDRFGQIAPRVLFATDGAYYGGAVHDVLPRVAWLRRELPSLERVVLVPYTRGDASLEAPGALRFDEALAGPHPGPIEFERFPFAQPLYVLYSSGTTGAPKCIVHGAGGTLLQHLKEHQLHADLRPGDRFFYFTTCGWMMWNWLTTGLASGATLILYDGSPFHPGPEALFDLASRERIALFGISAKFVDAVAKEGLEPRRTHDLSSVRAILSTGSPLAPEAFDFVYEKVKPDVQLSSISGGTDIVSCFVGGNPIGPVWRGEIQAPGLGMRVEVFDADGKPVVGEKGELVCTAPFPSMPLGFWNDSDGRRYRAAYFERFPGVWCHGDFAERTEHGGFVIHGRSDATLNPGGVRIGTAEIYRQVERLDEVLESLVIGQTWEGDVRIVLFVRLREGVALDDDLAGRIRAQIRRGASPRHVPAVIVPVADIPRTRSGKIVELAVADVVHGRPVANREALANPEALELFADLPELAR